MPYGTIDGQINAISANLGGTVTTTSTTVVSSGFGVTIGTNYTGRFLILAQISGSHSVIDTAVNFVIYRVTGGSIPSNGSATSGNVVSSAASALISPSAGGTVGSAILVVDSPGIGTFSYYIAYFGGAPGTSSLIFSGSNGSTVLTVVEI